jgi:SAM-dependent methyltransferase
MQTSVIQSGPHLQQFRQLTRYYAQPLYPGEHEMIAKAIERFDELTFAELVRFVDTDRQKLMLPWEERRIWRLAGLSEQEKQKYYSEHAERSLEAGRADVKLLRSLLDRFGIAPSNRRTRLLEIGTGRGNFLAAAQKEPTFSGWHFEGSDMDMASLVANLKLNEELHNTDYKLTCAWGENLPYGSGSFDIVVSFQTLEHVGNCERQVAFISDACRCLTDGGIGVFTFPNRFDLLRPEPHVYIRFLGFVPQRMKDAVSRRLRGVRSSDIYPPDPVTLMRGLKRVGGAKFTLLSNSEFSPSRWKQMAAKSWLFRFLGPWNMLVARKEPCAPTVRPGPGHQRQGPPSD